MVLLLRIKGICLSFELKHVATIIKFLQYMFFLLFDINKYTIRKNTENQPVPEDIDIKGIEATPYVIF